MSRIKGELLPVATLMKIAKRCQLTDASLAALIDISHHTLRFMIATGEMPERPRAARKVTAFIEANLKATRRSELRMVDVPSA